MLRYFRINDPYRLIGLLVLMLFIYLPLFIDPFPVLKPELRDLLVGERLQDGNRMYSGIADNTAPLAAWFHALVDMIFGRSLLARHIIAFLIIFFQAAFVGIIFITKKVFNENTFIPSLIFALLYTFSFDALTLSGELLGSGFLLLALNNLFREIEFRLPRDETTFNLGIYVSFASLFHFPYVIFLFGVLVILFLFARTDLRRVLLLTFGFVLPHLFVLAITFLSGSVRDVWEYYYLSSLSYQKEFLVPSRGLVLLSAIPIFYLVVSVIMLNRLARFTKYQSQLLQSIFLWIGFCFIYFLFCMDMRPQHLIVVVPPLTFLITHFLLLIRRKKFAEMNVWILLLGMVSILYLSRYDRMGGIDFSNLRVAAAPASPKNQRILVLTDRPEYYLNNVPATRYINWDLASRVFREPGYYETVTEVHDQLTADAPQVIVDPDNMLRPFLEQIPHLRSQYVRDDIFYRRKVSN